mmetsp:Transcript_36535/g.91439  ORF Transcript_36535/g.91439 Transcript_36535/m.91439 type:complete len:466 (-) Transcript_36535:107-1504(-)
MVCVGLARTRQRGSCPPVSCVDRPSHAGEAAREAARHAATRHPAWHAARHPAAGHATAAHPAAELAHELLEHLLEGRVAHVLHHLAGVLLHLLQLLGQRGVFGDFLRDLRVPQQSLHEVHGVPTTTTTRHPARTSTRHTREVEVGHVVVILLHVGTALLLLLLLTLLLLVASLSLGLAAPHLLLALLALLLLLLALLHPSLIVEFGELLVDQLLQLPHALVVVNLLAEVEVAMGLLPVAQIAVCLSSDAVRLAVVGVDLEGLVAVTDTRHGFLGLEEDVSSLGVEEGRGVAHLNHLSQLQHRHHVVTVLDGLLCGLLEVADLGVLFVGELDFPCRGQRRELTRLVRSHQIGVILLGFVLFDLLVLLFLILLGLVVLLHPLGGGGRLAVLHRLILIGFFDVVFLALGLGRYGGAEAPEVVGEELQLRLVQHLGRLLQQRNEVLQRSDFVRVDAHGLGRAGHQAQNR